MYISNIFLYQIFFLSLEVINSVGTLLKSSVRSSMSFTFELTENNYIVPIMIRIEDITALIIKARNLTEKIVYNIDHVDDNNFMTNLIKQHIFEFDEKFSSAALCNE